MRGRCWTKVEEDYITANWMTSSEKEIAEHLHRTEEAVIRKAWHLGYTKTMRKPEEHYVRFKR